jgi:16S rRNA (uracil1498-N3)-methyltransferase
LTSNHFFIQKSLAGGPWLYLEGREHHHLSKVVRLRPRDEIWLFDEDGARYRARIEDIGRQRTCLKLLEKLEPTKRRSKITLAQALLKAKPMDWVIQKATELGMFSFVPVLSERCVVKLEDRSAQKVQRWSQIAREASKQCRIGRVPAILAPQPLDDFLREWEADKKLFLSEDHGLPLKDIVRSDRDSERQPSDILILVGPEGGWTGPEEAKALRRGFEPVSLGPNILRAETASLAAMAILSHFWDS